MTNLQNKYDNSPIQYMNLFIDIYTDLSKTKDNQSKITVKDYASKVVSILKGIKEGLKQTEYIIKPINVKGKVYDLNNYKLTIKEIDNTYIFQPLEYVPEKEFKGIINELNELCKEKAFNEKAILVMPYDTKILKATLNIGE